MGAGDGAASRAAKKVGGAASRAANKAGGAGAAEDPALVAMLSQHNSAIQSQRAAAACQKRGGAAGGGVVRAGSQTRVGERR